MTTSTLPHHCTIRIAVTFLHDEGRDSLKVDYTGERFLVTRPDIIEAHGKTLIVGLEGIVLRSTGIASYLVLRDGHELRVHAQQIRWRRFSAGETIYRVGDSRQAVAMSNAYENESVSLHWLDGEDDRVLPEVVENEHEREQRQKPGHASVRKAWMEAAR